MTNKLEVMFRSYANAVQLKLQKEMKKQGAKEPLSLFTNKTMELRALVDELENEAEFHQLVVETRSAFLGGYHGKTESAWRQAVENFFRRSEYYSDIFEKRHVSIDETFQSYREAFKRREIQITYFAPMEFVYFNEQRMDFGRFQIRRFSADELKRALRYFVWVILKMPPALPSSCEMPMPQTLYPCISMHSLPRLQRIS